MSMTGITYIDVLIVIILAYYIIRGFQYGFWILFGRFFSLALSIVAAFFLYQNVGRLILRKYELLPSLAYGLGFIIVLIIFQILISFIVRQVLALVPEHLHQHPINKLLGLIPGFFDGVVFLMFTISLLTIAPIPARFQEDVNKSFIANEMIGLVSSTESYINNKFGGVLNQALMAFTTRPESDESVILPFKPRTTSVNEKSEARMLELLNQERIKVGVKPLVLDETIIPVARAHSQDMWEHQYFSHTSFDGRTLLERMQNGNVRFITAGENIALAQSVELAHRGLMNSPGHKRNILDPNFTRIGIGVINGGVYGEMYTQNFAR